MLAEGEPERVTRLLDQGNYNHEKRQPVKNVLPALKKSWKVKINDINSIYFHHTMKKPFL